MPTERLDRWHITVRLSDLAERNAEFRAAFLQQPRLLSALAAFEGIGVGPASYLWQVREATVVEETPGLHWLILPACHHGCQALETLPAGSCIVCGNPRGCAGTSKQRDSPWDLIHDIDERIIRLVQADPSARDRLLLDATSFFGELASAKFRRTAASLGIHEVRVAEDTETSVCFALLATHEPQRCTLALERGFA
jgi:hypothetical protein